MGVVIGVLALLGMGVFFWWRNRKANKPARVQGGFVGELPGAEPSPQQHSFISIKGNIRTVNQNNQAEKTHLPPYSDHPARNPAAELAGNRALQELP